MKETTAVILKKYAGYQLLLRLEARVCELEEFLLKIFLDEFYPTSQPVSRDMLSYILDRSLPLIWARTSSERDIESAIREIDLAQNHITRGSLGVASLLLSMSLIEEF